MSILLLGENLSLSQSRFLLVVDLVYFGFVAVVKLYEVAGLPRVVEYQAQQSNFFGERCWLINISCLV